MKLTPTPESSHTNSQSGSLGDGLGKGMEFAGVVFIFLGLGWLLDRSFDTKPVFMLALTVVGMVGYFLRVWFQYDAEMKRHEADRQLSIHGEGARS